jgi:hypothetical protein
MALSERLALLIDINGASAVAELNKVGAAADRELGKAEDRTQRMGTKFQTVGIGMMATAATIGAGLYAAGKGAAELEQSVGGTEAVFESSSGVIDTWAKGADTAAGLSEQAARRLTTQIGGALQGLGFAQDEAASKSIELTQIGADLAATYGGTTTDAVQALGSALRGEFDPMEQFNVFLKQSEIDAKAVELGLAANTNEVDKNARAQATLAMITEQSSAAQGQFGRESNTASGQMAIMEAQTQNAKDALGAGMLPVMSKVASVVGTGASKFLELDQSMGGTLSTGLAVGVGILGVGGAISTTVGWVIKMKSGFADAASSAKDFVSGLRTVPGAIQAISFTGAAVGLALFTQRMAENREEADKWASGQAGGGTIPEQIAEVEEALRKAREESEKYASVDVLGAHLWGSNEGREKADQVDALQRKLDALKATEADAANAADLNARGVDSMGNSLDGAQGPTDDLTQAVEDNKKAYEDAAKAREDFWNPGFDLESASIAAMEGHQNLATAITENGISLDLATEAGRNNREAFLDAAKAALEEAEALKQNGASNEEAAAAARNHIAGLKDQMVQAGFSRQSVEMLSAALNLTPREINIMFQTPGLDLASAKAADLMRALERLSNGDYNLANLGSNIGSGIAGLPAGRASGGSAMPYAVHPVGENGSEVVSTPTGSVLVMGNEAASVRPVETRQASAATQVIQLVVDGRVLAQVLNDYQAGLN